jgi:hypothetical protein
MSYQYCQEAKERISALGQVAITEFIEEIPPGLLTILYKRLPRVAGFRQGSQAEFKEKHKRLIMHLANLQTNQKGVFDWTILGWLWEAWARTKLGEKFPKSDNTDSIYDDGPTFLKHLADQFPQAAREDVERLFTFSCFPDHPNTVLALERFTPAQDLARDRMVDELPIRLLEIEDSLKSNETTARGMLKRLEQLEAGSTSHASSATAMIKDISRTSHMIAEMQIVQNAESARTNMLERVVDRLSTIYEKKFETIATVETRVVALEQSVCALMARGDGWDETSSELDKTKAAIAALASQEVDWARAAEHIRTIEERVTAMEGILANGRAGTRTKPQIKLLENKPIGPFVDIISVTDACDLIASNLQAVGVMKGSAISTARQTVAAFIAGQMVQLSGSLADFLADAIAAAVGGPSYHEWRVPVGLVSDEAAFECIENLNQMSGCLLLKRANLSAFEVYGTAIREVIVRRQFAEYDCGPLALIASWAQGPAAFPGGGMLAELGPVFDTDTLSIRGVSAKLPQLQFGRLAKGSWRQIEGYKIEVPARTATEFMDLLSEVELEGNNLWKRVVSHIYAILSAMPGGNSPENLHSLLVSWALPYAKATGGPAEKIAQIASREIAEQRAAAIV